MTDIVPFGLYLVKDQYFVDFPNDRYMDKTDRRPHFYAIQDKDGILWMSPISSKVEKYRARIASVERTSGVGSCFLYYIAKIHGQERAILICDMFPVTEEYISRPYTVGGIPYVMKNRTDIEAIQKRAKRFLSMVKRGKAKSPLNIFDTFRNLLRK